MFTQHSVIKNKEYTPSLLSPPHTHKIFVFIVLLELKII